MEEHDFNNAFLTQRVAELEAIGQTKDPVRSVEDVITYLKHGLAGGDFTSDELKRQPGQSLNDCCAQVYADAHEALCNALVYRDNVSSLVDALDTFVAGG